MSDYTPQLEQIRQEWFEAETLGWVPPEIARMHEARFNDAMKEYTREVERAAAEKAYERCVREMPFDTDWKIFYVDNNPYRAAGLAEGEDNGEHE